MRRSAPETYFAFYYHLDIIEDMGRLKDIEWVGSAKKDLKSMPDGVQDVFGFALHLAQAGKKHAKAKPLHGFGSAGVVEIVEDADGGAYRAVYTLRFADVVYVLHCFQKKSTQGIATPKPEMDLIRSRLKLAEAHHGACHGKN